MKRRPSLATLIVSCALLTAGCTEKTVSGDETTYTTAWWVRWAFIGMGLVAAVFGLILVKLAPDKLKRIGSIAFLATVPLACILAGIMMPREYVTVTDEQIEYGNGWGSKKIISFSNCRALEFRKEVPLVKKAGRDLTRHYMRFVMQDGSSVEHLCSGLWSSGAAGGDIRARAMKKNIPLIGLENLSQ
jgi:hypothetical protein